MESEVGPEVVVGSQIENKAARKLIVEGTAKEIAGRYEAIAGLMAIEASEGYREFGYSSLVQFARVEAKLSQRDLRDRLRIGHKLVEVPELDLAFREGVLSWSKVKTLIPVITKENGHEWIVRSMKVSVNDLEHIVGGKREPIVGERMVPMAPVPMDVWLSLQQVSRMLRLHTGSKELSDDECLRQIIEIARERLAGPASSSPSSPSSVSSPTAAERVNAPATPSGTPSSRHIPVPRPARGSCPREEPLRERGLRQSALAAVPPRRDPVQRGRRPHDGEPRVLVQALP